MTRKKTKKVEESKSEDTKTVKDRFQDAKEKRKLAYEAKNKSPGTADKTREEFRRFFIKNKSKLKLDKDMELVLWTHFKAYGYDKKEKFEDGIKHFGYKLK